MKMKQLKYQNNFEKYLLFFLNVLRKLQNWGERGWVNNSTPSYQMQQVPDRREEKCYLQEVCVTHFLVIRQGVHQLPSQSTTYQNIPKTILASLYSPPPELEFKMLRCTLQHISRHLLAYLPPCLAGMLSLLLVNKTPFWKSWSETGTSTDYQKYT